MKDNDTKKRALVSDLVHLEWELFRRVNNEGERPPVRPSPARLALCVPVS